jgi:hypothetical protein
MFTITLPFAASLVVLLLSLTHMLHNNVCTACVMPKQGGSVAVHRASQPSVLEDPGLDGFVHMNMIDDLLTE